MKTKNLLQAVSIFCVFMFASYSAYANNISVSNFSFTGQNAANHYTMVKFDIQWENSFRESTGPSNWDAAWVFVKYRIGAGAWQHAWLNNTGHVNPTGSTISTGLFNPALLFNQTTNPGIGAFIYRSADGSGTFSKTGVQLRWNYGANGVSNNANVDIWVYAIEMVYVPQGNFSAGSGGTENGAFYKYPTTTNPFQITSEGAITVGTATDNLYYPYTSYSGDQLGPIPAAFPKGYNAFYCMKYEITQQGYVDFLNSLTQAQATIRKQDKYDIIAYNHRYEITGSVIGSYATTNPFVACNHLGWSDVAAYLDWCGLRPMTEFEFEKSCRGTLPSVPNEYAWGTTGIASSAYTLSNSGLTNENIATNYSTSLGNAALMLTTPYQGSIDGPVRVGIFAGNGLNTGRVSSGATYYGIMEMTGNVWEKIVTVGNPTGRTFTGTHGNGLLTVTGDADALLWPNADALGAGVCGSNWYHSDGSGRVSERHQATYSLAAVQRHWMGGGRGVRSMP